MTNEKVRFYSIDYNHAGNRACWIVDTTAQIKEYLLKDPDWEWIWEYFGSVPGGLDTFTVWRTDSVAEPGCLQFPFQSHYGSWIWPKGKRNWCGKAGSESEAIAKAEADWLRLDSALGLN